LCLTVKTFWSLADGQVFLDLTFALQKRISSEKERAVIKFMPLNFAVAERQTKHITIGMFLASESEFEMSLFGCMNGKTGTVF